MDGVARHRTEPDVAVDDPMYVPIALALVFGAAILATFPWEMVA